MTDERSDEEQPDDDIDGALADDVREGYIADAHRDNPDAQRDLALKLLHSAQRARVQAERQAAALERDAERLAYKARQVRLRGEETADRREGLVRSWFAADRTRRHWGDRLDLGDAVVRWAKKRLSYKVNDAAVIARALEDPTLYAQGIVTTVPKVDAKAARKRFALGSSGDVVDEQTGEVLGPVPHVGADGQELTSPLLVVTEPGHYYTAITYPKDGQTEEVETDGSRDGN